MRVAMILNSFPEISEKFLLNQIIALVEAGVELDVYPAHRPEGNDVHDLFEKYRIAGRVRYVDVPRSMKRRLPAAIAAFFRFFVRNPTAALRALDIGSYRTVAKNCKLIFFGLRLCGESYDVVHCHFGVNGLIGSYLKDCGFARSLIVTFHGSDINTYPSRYGLDVYRTLYDRADVVTVNTTFTGDKVAMNGCPREKIRVHPVGLIPAEYADVSRDAIEAHSILTVGRLVEKKGHAYMLRAVPEILASYPDAVWYVVGDGSELESLKALARELGVERSVRFLGQCANDTVKSMYCKAAAFVLPSVTASDGDMEGQGLVLQEAQYCRVPVVSTLHNGIPDGVLDGESGYLVPERDPRALADRICAIFADQGAAREMGERGHTFVADHYDVTQLSLTMKAWYSELP